MTIKELAEKAGVSTATVSRLINDSGYVHPETAATIRKAIKETGYKPARRRRGSLEEGPLAKLRNCVFAMVWTGTGHVASETQSGQQMMAGMSKVISAVGARLLIEFASENTGLSSRLLSDKVEGLFLHGPAPAQADMDLLRRFPVVWLLQSGSTRFGDRVQPDHAAAGRMACEALQKRGCERLACVSYAPTTPTIQYWESRAYHFARAARLAGIECRQIDHPPPTEGMVFDVGRRTEIAEALVTQLLDQSPRIDGLFVANDVGVYVHTALLRHGVDLMQDLALVAGDTHACGPHLHPDPIKIDIAAESLGQLAAELLFWRLKHPAAPRLTHLIEPQIVLP
jgi:LacI family transcriptional regulator